MPNHVHILAATNARHELGDIVRSWKTFTAHRINETLARTGSVWAPDYFDRYVRDQRQYDAAKRYIEMNPVAAGLCAVAADWPYSSASRK